MARNVSGTYSLPSAAPNPVISGTTITSTGFNTTLGDVATELTDSLSRTGKGGMTAPLRCADGTVAAPAHSFTSETGSGWFRHAAGELRCAILGVYRLALTAAGLNVIGDLGASGALNVSGAATAASLTTYDRVNVYDGEAGKRVSIDAAAGQAADYSLTLPAAVPASTLPVTMTSAGVLATAQLVNAQQNFGTPSADTDVAIKSYADGLVVPSESAVSSINVDIPVTPVVQKLGGLCWFKGTSGAIPTLSNSIQDAGEAFSGGESLFTVPAGYRPEINAVRMMTLYDASATAESRHIQVFIRIATDGVVKAHFPGQSSGAASFNASDVLYLDDVSPWTPA